jgi:hypothetical protein
VAGSFAMMVPRGCGARTGERLFVGSVFQTSVLTIRWTITAMQARRSLGTRSSRSVDVRAIFR